MSWLIAALVGAAGGAISDAYRLAAEMKATKTLPWRGRRQRAAAIAVIAIDVFGGGIFAGVLSLSGSITSAIWAFVAGYSAPMILQRLSAVAWTMLHGAPGPPQSSEPSQPATPSNQVAGHRE